MKDNRLSRWLYSNECFLKTGDKNDRITHICLDGGRLSIPEDKYDMFLRKYAQFIEEPDEKYYICETVSDIVKMYFDFDFVLDREIVQSEFEKIYPILNDSIMDVFGKEYKFFVCFSKSKKTKIKDIEKTKTGVHVIFQGLYVTPAMAKTVCLYTINLLNSKLNGTVEDWAPFGSIEDWGSVVDRQVYNNGLRMIGSRKVVKKRKKTEDGSKQEIEVDENRPYWPIDYPVGILEQYSKYELLEMCCIRTNQKIPTLPILDLDEYANQFQPNSENERLFQQNDPIMNKIGLFIQNQTIPEWNSEIKQLRKMDGFYLAKIESMYCLNARREHNSCGIYFHISLKGLQQRCFCKCETKEGRVNGLCRDFRSDYFKLPLEIKKLLFPKCKTTESKPQKKKPNGIQKEIYGSNTLLRSGETLERYLKMSLNTILDIEKNCK